MKFDKTQSDVVKGVAMLLMLAHHLFGFTDRYPEGAVDHVHLNGYLADNELGVLGKICVALFLLVSGYAAGLKSPTSMVGASVQSAHRISGFYLLFWINCAILLGFSYFYGVTSPSWANVSFIWDWYTLVRNLALYRITYSGEWWFAGLFLMLLLWVYPPVFLLSKWGLWLPASVSVLFCLGSVCLGWHSPYAVYYWQVFSFLPISTAGVGGGDSAV